MALLIKTTPQLNEKESEDFLNEIEKNRDKKSYPKSEGINFEKIREIMQRRKYE